MSTRQVTGPIEFTERKENSLPEGQLGSRTVSLVLSSQTYGIDEFNKTMRECENLSYGMEKETLIKVKNIFGQLRAANEWLKKVLGANSVQVSLKDRLALNCRFAQFYVHTALNKSGSPDEVEKCVGAALKFLDHSFMLPSERNGDSSAVRDRVVALRASIVAHFGKAAIKKEINFPSVQHLIDFLVDSGDHFVRLGAKALAVNYYKKALAEISDDTNPHRSGSIDPLKKSLISQRIAEYESKPVETISTGSVRLPAVLPRPVLPGVEKSNEKFMGKLKEVGLSEDPETRQLIQLEPHHNIGAIQWNPGRYLKSQKDFIIETCKLCETLPRGYDQETLLEVGKNYDRLARVFEMLGELEAGNENFKIGNRESYMIRYCLAQAHASRGEAVQALQHLNRLISSIGRHGILKRLNSSADTFWPLAISLRTDILAKPNAPTIEHNVQISCMQTYLDFLIETGIEFQRKEHYRFAALYYESALNSEGERGAVVLDPQTKNSIHEFLAKFYLNEANKIKERSFIEALGFYDKSLKFDRRDDVVSYVLRRCEEKKSESADLAVQIRYLRVMIQFVSSHGNSQTRSKLAEYQGEIFDRYVDLAVNCLSHGDFEQSIVEYEKTLKVEELSAQGFISEIQVRNAKLRLFEAIMNKAYQLDVLQESRKAESLTAQAIKYKNDNNLRLSPEDESKVNQFYTKMKEKNRSNVDFKTRLHPSLI